jgi:hypothetical protein
MALSFPTNPTIGQQYAAPNGFTYTWNGTTWTATTGGSGGSSGGGGSPIEVVSHGTVISTSATVFNFTGTNLSATGANNAVTVTVNTGSTLVNGTYTVSLANDGGFVLPYGAQLFDNGSWLTITPVNTLSNYAIQIIPSDTDPDQYAPTPNDIHIATSDPTKGLTLGIPIGNRSWISIGGSDASNEILVGTFNTVSNLTNYWVYSTDGRTAFPPGYVFPNTTGTYGQSLVLDTDGLTLVWSTATAATGVTLHYWAEENTVIDSTQTAITTLMVSGTQTNIDAVIQPQGSGASLADSTGNKRGSYATDWQKQRGSASQVASGDYSIISGGSFNAATGLHSVVVGGNNNLANSNYSTIVGGHGGTTRGITGAVVFPGYATGGVESSQGVMQSAIYNIGAITSNSTPVRMSTDGNPTPTANNQIGIGDRSVAYFKGTVIAKEDAISNACIWAWDFKGVLRQDVGAITTDFVPAGVAPALSTITNTTTVANLILDLDNVTGCMIIEAVGPVGKTVRWTGKIETVEVTDNS